MGAVTVANFQEFYVDYEPSCHTSEVTAGDVLAATENVKLTALGPTDTKNHVVKITRVTALDKDDNGVALDLYFLTDNVALGTEGSAISITDANAESIGTYVSLNVWKDLIGSRWSKTAVAEEPVLITGNNVYLAVVCNDTATFTASGLKFRIWYQIQR